MLYLIKNKDYYKIGFTDKLSKRLSSYKTHNPECLLVGLYDGTRELENSIHQKYNEYLLDNSEWMLIPTKESILLENTFRNHYESYFKISTDLVYVSNRLTGVELKILFNLFLFSYINITTKKMIVELNDTVIKLICNNIPNQNKNRINNLINSITKKTDWLIKIKPYYFEFNDKYVKFKNFVTRK